MSVFSQLGQAKEQKDDPIGMLIEINADGKEVREPPYLEYQHPRTNEWRDVAMGTPEDRLWGCRAVFGAKQRGEPMQATHRRIYALGCWLALEHLCDRLTNGNAMLCQMREQGEQESKRFDRLSVAWLKLGFRSIALIGRMGWADPEIERQFCQSPTGQYFADTEWPDAPPTCDLDTLLVQPRLVA